MSNPSFLHNLRREIKKRRCTLSRFTQQISQRHVLNQLRKHSKFIHSRKIGLYLDAFGEIHTRSLMDLCFYLGKQVYLPMICSMNQCLVWVPISRQQYYSKRFSRHVFGMNEPMASRGQHVSTLDLLILPLLACDAKGTRLGMGGGYYDRTLASAPHKPFRMGIAHDFQFLMNQQLHRQPWDQPLDALITPSKLTSFKR